MIMSHQKMFRDYGYDYLYICPTSRKCRRYWEVVYNNEHRGVKNTVHLIHYISLLSISEIHIHHLITASLGETEKLLSSVKKPIRFYLHDYYTICPFYKLLRNDKEKCGFEKMSFHKCGDCIHYKKGIDKNKRLQRLLCVFADRLSFIAPSDYVKTNWSLAYPEYRDRVYVVYHQQLIGAYDENKNRALDTVKIAYLGEPIGSKGWDVWQRLVYMNNTRKEQPYRFYYFGKYPVDTDNQRKVNVDYHTDMNAMIEALRRERIDCAVIWALWGETYSFTYYECLASNVFVITNNLSGNIADQVKKRKNGIVLDSVADLDVLLADGERFRDLINRFKESDIHGPLELRENPEIVSMVTQQSIRDNDDENMSRVAFWPTPVEAVLTKYVMFRKLCHNIRKKRRNNTR